MDRLNNLNYLMHHLAAVMGKQSDQILQEQLGIGFSQYKILMVLEWNPRIGQKAIADNLGQTEASISRQIKLLKQKGLLISKTDNQNKRKHMSFPTPLGMQLTEAANSILRKNLNGDYDRLDEASKKNLEESLKQLHNQVCRPGKFGACDHQLGI